jgi:hypothetical protein
VTIARLAPAYAARSHARPRAVGRLLALSADACACVVLTAVIPLALGYGTAGPLRPPGPGLPAMAAAVPVAAAMIGRTGRDWQVLVAGLAAMGLAGQLGDVASSFPLTWLAALVRGAGAGLALTGAVAFARGRQQARARQHAWAGADGPGAVPLRWWWAAVTVMAVVCAPAGGAGPAGGERRDMLTVGALAAETAVVIALAALAARGRALRGQELAHARRARPAFLVLAAAAGCTLTVAGSLAADRRTLALAASAVIAAAAFAARRPLAGVGGTLLTGGVLAYLLAASPPALMSGLPAALLAAALAAALSAALARGAFGGSGPSALYLKTYAAAGAPVRYPGASGVPAAWPGGHHLVAGAVVLVSGILVGYLTVGVLQGSGYSGAAGITHVVHR